MIKDSAGIVQAMPLLEGKTNLDAGPYVVNELIHCVTAAVVTVEWSTGTTAEITMVEGQDFAFTGAVTVDSGTIHIS